MKLLSPQQTREADAYTIQHEPIASIDLMERASQTCVDYIKKNLTTEQTITVVAGTGNNGGDGLAIARLLAETGYTIKVFAVHGERSPDCAINYERLANVKHIELLQSLQIDSNDLIIDALFGTGLTRPVSGEYGVLIDQINAASNHVISIDMPSGLFVEDNTTNNGKIVRADKVLSFQMPKLSFLLEDNFKYVANFEILDIGLSQDFIDACESPYNYLRSIDLNKHNRPKNAYKHQFGHALLIAGSENMMGAAILSASACMRSGVGLATAHIPSSRANALFAAAPEVMHSYRENGLAIPNKCSAIAIGPGLGLNAESEKLVDKALNSHHPLLIDADALTIIAAKKLYTSIPKNSILTPHAAEFDRLFGEHSSAWSRLQTQIEKSKSLDLIIVLKGAHTSITLPDGTCYFNSTGNPSMATAGSGDVLTGVITSMLAQGYTPKDAALNGVYLHGLAGDIASDYLCSIIASDIIEALPHALCEQLTIHS